jgi:ATP-dependent protease HslVU (ClpYQ) peptidase subunit
MSTTLRFRQHDDFQWAALRMAGAGAVAGLLSFAAFGGAASPWVLGIVAIAAIFGALSPTLRVQPAELATRAGLGAMAAATLVLLTRAGEPTVALAGFGVFFGAALGWGLRGARLAIAVLVGVAVASLARFTFLSIAHAQELASLPGWLVATGAGAAFSMVSVFALLPRHIELEQDQVAKAYEQLAGSVTGEVRELVDRGYALWTQTTSQLDADDINRATLGEGVLKLLEVARRWRSVDGLGTQTMASTLVERMEALEQRIEKTEDEVTRAQYEQARAALAEQLRYIKDIGISRERVVARMHNYLAAMERLRMAVINLESTNASREAVNVQPLVSSIEEIGADMDSCSEALLEVDRLSLRAG